MWCGEKKKKRLNSLLAWRVYFKKKRVMDMKCTVWGVYSVNNNYVFFCGNRG